MRRSQATNFFECFLRSRHVALSQQNICKTIKSRHMKLFVAVRSGNSEFGHRTRIR